MEIKVEALTVGQCRKLNEKRELQKSQIIRIKEQIEKINKRFKFSRRFNLPQKFVRKLQMKVFNLFY